jgi:hypothetical protein
VLVKLPPVDAFTSTALLAFTVQETNTLVVGTIYFWQLELALVDGEVLIPVDWTNIDVDLGGSAAPIPPPFPNRVKIDHNYGLPNDLQYVTPGGSPIENAQVRLYLKSDYDAGKLDMPVGVTTTNAFGQWSQPMLVATGYNYVVRIEKPYEFGPDVRVIFA